MAAMISTNGFARTGDFFRNVMKALEMHGGDHKALRLDELADLVEPLTSDGSHRFRVLEKIKAAVTSEELGLTENPFELISAREQAGYGFPEAIPALNSNGEAITELNEEGKVVVKMLPVFPKAVMGDKPGVRKRTRKARLAVGEAAGTDESKPVNYWPIVAIKNAARASMKQDIKDIADFVHQHIQAKYNGRYDVILGGKNFTVKFGGVTEEDSDEEFVNT